MRSVLYWAIQRRWLLIAFAVGGVLLLLPLPTGLTPHGRQALVIAFVAMILFVSEPIPLPAIALMIPVLQVLLGIDTPADVAHSFMNDSVFFILGSLMLAVAIVKQKVDRRLAVMIFRITGPKIQHIVFGLIAFSSFLASLIGEHTVAAIMMPVVMRLVEYSSDARRGSHRLASLLLFSVAYSCAIAGIGTPSGGARNAIMIEYWSRLFDRRVSYFDWIMYAYPMVLLQAPVLGFVLLRRFRSEKADLSHAIRKLKAQVFWEGKMRGRDWLTVSIFGVTLLMWVFFSGRIGLGAPALIGVCLYLITGLVEWEEINAGVNWGVFLIYAATISLGTAIDATGAASWVAGWFMTIVSSVGLGSGVGLLAAVAVLTVVVSSFISRAPALGILTPIVLAMALDTGTNILAMGFTTAIASAFTYMTIIGSPANTIIFSSGQLQTRDYLRAGLWMTFVSLLLLLLFSQTYWRVILPN